MEQDKLRYLTNVDEKAPRRYCEIHDLPEISALEKGMDFRHPQYRREVFLRFYESHLIMGAHPGLVYLLMPYFFNKYRWGWEERLWFAFINGNTQNPVTSRLIFDRFPDFVNLDISKLETWFNQEYKRLEFDSDRKWQKKDFIKAVRFYKNLCGNSQEDYFSELMHSDDQYENWRMAWPEIRKFESFGRLSTFSYMEYLRIMRLPVDCDNLLLEDMEGSKSHRNGLSKVLGLDVWDWHPQSNPDFLGKYTPEMLDFLNREAAILIQEAKERFKGRPFYRDVSYFTLESTFCTFKGHFRKNRRYPGVYIDMHHGRIKRAEALWPDEDFSDQWEARKSRIPEYFLLECNPADPGLQAKKQNHFRDTGEMIMIDYWWPCFQNGFNQERARKQGQAYAVDGGSGSVQPVQEELQGVGAA